MPQIIPTTVQEVKEFRQWLFQESMALIDRKGADYNRDQQDAGDTLFNLRVSEILGITPSTEEGILVRLSDKFMRLISLTKPGREAAVKDESVLDTIKDVHNYVDYLGLIWLQRRQGAGTQAAAPVKTQLPLHPAENPNPEARRLYPTRAEGVEAGQVLREADAQGRYFDDAKRPENGLDSPRRLR